MQRLLPILLGLAVAAGGAFAAYYFLRSSHTPTAKTDVVIPRTPSPRTPPTGEREYHNTTYHFSLFYPATLAVTEYKEKGTALTVTFEKSDENQGFQVFVTPYGGDTITPERLRQDIPSGVIEEQRQVLIDSKSAVMFFSHDSLLGDTREVWFIHHGFLFEVTAPKEEDEWLSNIMTSWDLW